MGQEGSLQLYTPAICAVVRAKYGQHTSIFLLAMKADHQQNIRKTLVNQEAFLSNERNKSQFMALLSHHQKADNQTIHRVWRY